MAINAIGASSYNTNNKLYQNISTLSTQKLDEMMKQYGINPTGNKSEDIKALYKAMAANNVNSVQNTQSSTNIQQQAQSSSQSSAATGSNNVPWATLMTQVGLTASGDKSKDYAAFNERVTELQEALSGRNAQEGTALISQLEKEAEIVFGQQSSSTEKTETKKNSSSNVTGADILSQLNKTFLVKK